MDLFETHILGAPLSEVSDEITKLRATKSAICVEIDEQTNKLLNPLLSDDMLRSIESNILRMINRIDDYNMAIRMAGTYIDSILGRGNLIESDN